MTWTMISANTSHCVNGDTFEITDEAVRILREHGWVLRDELDPLKTTLRNTKPCCVAETGDEG